MRTLLVALFVIGFETRAMVHEDQISVFDYPAHLALTNMLYALPGIGLLFALRLLLPTLHIAVRLVIASVVPFFLWFAVFFVVSQQDISFREGLENLTWAIFSTDFSAMFALGIIAVCGVGFFDHWKYSKPTKTGRYSGAV